MGLPKLPPEDGWLTELAALEEPARGARLRAMQAEARAACRCGSLQTWKGLPCRRTHQVGYTVCPNHGALAPATVAKAERMLAAARIPAVTVINDQLTQFLEETCDQCGYPHHSLKERKHITSLSYKALDRLGLGPRSTIDINARNVDEHKIDVSNLMEIERSELRTIIDQMEDFKARVLARQARDSAALVLAPAGANRLGLAPYGGVVEPEKE